MVVLAMVVILAKHGMLIFALLENVFGTLQWTGGLPPMFMRIMLVLRDECPEFYWGIDKMFAQLYKLGASRRRAFLKGIKNTHISVPRVPPPLSCLGQGSVRDYLTPGLPNNALEDFTDAQQQNLRDLEVKVKQRIALG